MGDGRVPTMRVVPGLDEVEGGHLGFGLGLEATAVQQLASNVAKKPSHIALSKQSPTEPMEGRMQASLQRAPKAIDVYCVPWSVVINDSRKPLQVYVVVDWSCGTYRRSGAI